MGFEELPIKSSTAISTSPISPSSRFENLDNISAKAAETRPIETTATNNIVKGPQSAISPTGNLPIPSLVADAALISTLVAGISTGILLELPEQALPPLEEFRTLIAGAILADNPKHYQNHRPAEITREVFRAPELTTEPKTKNYSTPCSPLSKTKLREKVEKLNRSWQLCLAPELSPVPKRDTHSPETSQHHLNKTARSNHRKI